ncbi:DUF1460 domain-containing protein [Klebsiella pneumoniae]|nr:DUF1460 domain-containing protein [Klebsiella pneumoniae]
MGIYSTKRGLDVSHVGIIIKDHNNIWFRNASSLAKNRKVVDSPLLDTWLQTGYCSFTRENRSIPLNSRIVCQAIAPLPTPKGMDFYFRCG